MKTNLFLLLVIGFGGWYLYTMQPPTPEAAAPAPQRAARTDYSGTRTFYSTLNDPAVPVGGNRYSTNNVYRGSSASQSALNPVYAGASNGGGYSYQTPDSAAPRSSGYPSGNGDPTLNIKQRAVGIGDAVKGE